FIQVRFGKHFDAVADDFGVQIGPAFAEGIAGGGLRDEFEKLAVSRLDAGMGRGHALFVHQTSILCRFICPEFRSAKSTKASYPAPLQGAASRQRFAARKMCMPGERADHLSERRLARRPMKPESKGIMKTTREDYGREEMAQGNEFRARPMKRLTNTALKRGGKER